MQIIEATVNCLAVQGIETTSLEAVGKASGIARSHIIYYFKNKEELFDAAFKYVIANAQDLFVQMMESKSDPVELLEAYVDSVFLWIEKYENHARVMLLFYHCATSVPAYRKLHTELRLAARHRIVAILQQLLSPKKKSAAQIEECALSIHCLLTGYGVEFLTTNSKIPLTKIKERALAGVMNLAQQKS